MVDRSSFSCVGNVFHAGGAATEKAVSSIRRRVRGTTRSPDDEPCSADRAGTSVTKSYFVVTLSRNYLQTHKIIKFDGKARRTSG